jgi:hypothetical protein
MGDTEEIKKLEIQIARDIGRDKIGRATDAATHLRRAMDILAGELRPSEELARVTELLGAATDILIGTLGGSATP